MTRVSTLDGLRLAGKLMEENVDPMKVADCCGAEIFYDAGSKKFLAEVKLGDEKQEIRGKTQVDVERRIRKLVDPKEQLLAILVEEKYDGRRRIETVKVLELDGNWACWVLNESKHREKPNRDRVREHKPEVLEALKKLEAERVDWMKDWEKRWEATLKKAPPITLPEKKEK